MRFGKRVNYVLEKRQLTFGMIRTTPRTFYEGKKLRFHSRRVISLKIATVLYNYLPMHFTQSQSRVQNRYTRDACRRHSDNNYDDDDDDDDNNNNSMYIRRLWKQARVVVAICTRRRLTIDESDNYYAHYTHDKQQQWLRTTAQRVISNQSPSRVVHGLGWHMGWVGLGRDFQFLVGWVGSGPL